MVKQLECTSTTAFYGVDELAVYITTARVKLAK